MVQEFFVGILDSSQINFGVILLVPKVVGAMDIRQFVPITAIKVDLRIFPKVCAMWLTPIVDKLVLQINFVKSEVIMVSYVKE